MGETKFHVEKYSNKELTIVDTGNTMDDFHTAIKVLGEVACELAYLGRAFYETGNEHMGEKLRFLSKDLDSGKEVADQMFSKQLHDMYDQSTQASNNMLAAAISGSMLGREAAMEELEQNEEDS